MPFEQRLGDFYAHLERCFSSKPNPPPAEFFRNHWENDPRKSLDSIFSTTHDGMISSSVRVYLRCIGFGGAGGVGVGAVGDVATNPLYRRRGLATKLLHEAAAYENSLHLNLSMLHASQDAVQLYLNHGYIQFPMSSTSLATSLNPASSEEISDLNADAVDVCARVHEFYTRGIVGCFVRDKLYWEMWVLSNIDPRSRIIHRVFKSHCTTAYMISRKKSDNVIEVMEFAIFDGHSASAVSISEFKRGLVALIQDSAFMLIPDSSLVSVEFVSAMIPDCVLDAIGWPDRSKYVDNNWMFRVNMPFQLQDGTAITDNSQLETFMLKDVCGTPFHGCPEVSHTSGENLFGFMKIDAF